MESPTLDAMKKELVCREALHAYQHGMQATDVVVQYAFWHLDKKRGGKLSGSVDANLLHTNPLQFIEMVMEQVQIDLLTGAARKHHAVRQASARTAKKLTEVTESQPVRLVQESDARTLRPPRTHIQDVARKWKAVVSKQNELAEESVDWLPHRVAAMQKRIEGALIAWQTCVDLPGKH